MSINKAIGVFDSGIGGLTVLKEIIRLFPHEDTIYLGDTARVPYGTKSAETVTRYSLEISDFLVTKGIKLLVVACNTASAVALPALREKHSLPIIGVIEPGARKAVATTQTKKVGVIGTEGTIKSGAYEKAIKALAPEIEVISKPCPLFVPLAEEGWTDNDVARSATSRYLEDMKGVDTLVLGCTHYPLLKSSIASVMGTDVRLIDSGEETALEVRRVLSKEGLLRRLSQIGKRTFYVTDTPERFVSVGLRFLGGGLDHAERVEIP
ncbi:MAG: glutamate racemase [Deltaproteobacteria bacterium]